MIEPATALSDVSDHIERELNRRGIPAGFLRRARPQGHGDPWEDLIEVHGPRGFTICVVLIRSGPNNGKVYVRKFCPEELAFDPLDIKKELPSIIRNIMNQIAGVS